MEKYLQNLILEVAQGNPGAITVIRELQWFSRWEKMLRYFKETGLVGGALWAKFKDEYHQSIHDFGHAIDKEIWERDLIPQDPHEIKLPKFEA
jgi:hypothetical protein